MADTKIKRNKDGTTTRETYNPDTGKNNVDIYKTPESVTTSGASGDTWAPGMPSNIKMGQAKSLMDYENAQRRLLDEATVNPGEWENLKNQATERMEALTNLNPDDYTPKELVEKMMTPAYDKMSETIQNNNLLSKATEGLNKLRGEDVDASKLKTEETPEQQIADAENKAQAEASMDMAKDIENKTLEGMREGKDEGLANMNATDTIAQETSTPDNKYEKPIEETTGNNNGDTGNNNGNNNGNNTGTVEPFDVYKDIYDSYRAPKNGLDYLKRLWTDKNHPVAGKVSAITNVLGNLMGAVGKGAAKEGYESDWEKYKNNYIAAEQERNQREFNDNMDLIKQAKTNEQSRKDLMNMLNLAVQNGNLSPQELIAVQNFQTATSPSSALDKAIAAILTKINNIF